MRSNKKNTIVFTCLIILYVLLLLSMFLVYLLTDASDIFASIVTLIATIIGAFASIVEYRKNESVDMCNNILEIYADFVDVPTNKDIEYKLECLKRRNVNLFTKEDISGIRNYLMYFNSVAEIVLTNNIKISYINTILGYRFFLAMNSPYIQDLEIIPNAHCYKPCIMLHHKWKKWSDARGFKRTGDETSLEKRFDKYYDFV